MSRRARHRLLDFERTSTRLLWVFGTMLVGLPLAWLLGGLPVGPWIGVGISVAGSLVVTVYDWRKDERRRRRWREWYNRPYAERGPMPSDGDEDEAPRAAGDWRMPFEDPVPPPRHPFPIPPPPPRPVEPTRTVRYEWSVVRLGVEVARGHAPTQEAADAAGAAVSKILNEMWP